MHRISDSTSNHPPTARARPLADSVLRLIWRERKVSRAEIARQMNLSRSTVSEIVGALLPRGHVEEIGTGPSSGGRRPIVLEFKDESGCILGVEIGATHVAALLTDLRGRVCAWREQSHDVRGDPVGTRALAAELCDDCLQLAPKGRESLVGIGVAVPSPVDPADPKGLSEIVLPEWKGESRLDELRERYNVPLFVDNDANLGALAEHWWGAGLGMRDFAYVKLGTGVGSGHVINGDIYRGATGVAGEIGHLAIDPQGDPCVCGLRGCLTTFVGSTALEFRTRSLLSEFPDSSLAHGSITIHAIEDAALAGDELAVRIAREAAEHLGIAVAGMLNLMNPAAVILGGGLTRLGDLLLEPLHETIRHRTLVGSIAAAEIRVAELGPRAVAIGAATLVLDAALSDPRLLPDVVKAEELQ